MKIYTKTGDQGKSSLFSGERVSKNHRRMRAYGDVDELNAVIGVVVASLPLGTDEIDHQLRQVQADLFRVGAVLATTPASARAGQITPISRQDIQRLEAWIDALQGKLPELRNFILPGGHMAAAQGHAARTVCRRAERELVALMETAGNQTAGVQSILADVLIYLNRLSDYLFVMSRHCNASAGVDDVFWHG